MPEPAGLAFKNYEIEELADVYFFRPAGMIFARAARALALTPTLVTIAGTIVGIAGGALLHWDRLALAGFALIILHSVLDSSDGQLARMTGQVSEFGRMLDGLGGYFTHSAAYIAIGTAMYAQGGGTRALALMFGAGVSTILHAQMYDYHRGSYARTVIKGAPLVPPPQSYGAVRAYEKMQRIVSGLHPRVEEEIASRAVGGAVRAGDRARYRETFYWPVRGWNVLGDNTRFYAFGVCAWVHRLDWYFAFVLVPMNVAFAALWAIELRADRRFLAEPVIR